MIARLNAGVLARDCYPPSAQEFYNEMFERGSALLGDITGVIISETAPDPEDRDKAWRKTNAAGAPLYPFDFIWFNGAWVSPHGTPPGGAERRLWVGSTVDLQTYDGGEVGAVGDATGPFWEVDTAFEGRVLVAPGTVPGTSPARTVGVGATVDSTGDEGEWAHTIARAELPNERLHLLGDVEEGEDPATNPGATDVVARRMAADSDAQSYRLVKAQGFTDPTVGVTEALGQGEGFVNAPPFYGVYVIKRTARVYYRGT